MNKIKFIEVYSAKSGYVRTIGINTNGDGESKVIDFGYVNPDVTEGIRKAWVATDAGIVGQTERMSKTEFKRNYGWIKIDMA